MFGFTVLLPPLLYAIVVAQGTLINPQGTFHEASNQFALDLWHRLSAENEANQTESKNLFFSPYSIATLLSMVYVGTNGSTESQLGSALALKGAQLEDKQKLIQQIQKSSGLMYGNSAYTLNTANALIIDKDFQILDSFKNQIKGTFSGEIFSVNFRAESLKATDRINHWVAHRTQNKVKKILDEPLSSDTVMALVNAVYFKGKWNQEFVREMTNEGTFYGFNGTKYEKISFMKQIARFNCAKGKDFQMVELPYKGVDISMYAFLPNKNEPKQLDQMRSALNLSTIDQLIKQRQPSMISLEFPKLNLESRFDLKKTLISMGVIDLFDDNIDISGITDGKSSVGMAGVDHMARIDINEEGTEAGAGSISRFYERSAHPQMKFNRPFVFVIRHNKNGQILFVGEVTRF